MKAQVSAEALAVRRTLAGLLVELTPAEAAGFLEAVGLPFVWVQGGCCTGCVIGGVRPERKTVFRSAKTAGLWLCVDCLVDRQPRRPTGNRQPTTDNREER